MGLVPLLTFGTIQDEFWVILLLMFFLRLALAEGLVKTSRVTSSRFR